MTSNNSDIPTAIKERDRETGYPGYSSDPDPEAVDRLAKKHGIGLPPNVNYNFLSRIRWAAFSNVIIANLPYDTPKVRSQTKILAKKAVKLVDAIDEFDEALRGFDELSENPAEELPMLRRGVEVQLGQVRSDAESWTSAASQACEKFKASRPLKKNVGNTAFNYLLAQLIIIYVECTEKKAGLSFNQHTKNYTGPMFRFIVDCLNLLGVKRGTNKALGRAIEKTLKDKKQPDWHPLNYIQEYI